jgi:hypothetical protein
MRVGRLDSRRAVRHAGKPVSYRLFLNLVGAIQPVRQGDWQPDCDIAACSNCSMEIAKPG